MIKTIQTGLATLILSFSTSASVPPQLPQSVVFTVVYAADQQDGIPDYALDAKVTDRLISDEADSFGLSEKEKKLMSAISLCESNHHQYHQDGSLLRGVIDSDDVGAFQINERYNPNAFPGAYDLVGNIDYGIRLYKALGTSPWSASKPCWNKTVPGWYTAA